jgi:hypothetical protein
MFQLIKLMQFLFLASSLLHNTKYHANIKKKCYFSKPARRDSLLLLNCQKFYLDVSYSSEQMYMHANTN